MVFADSVAVQGATVGQAPPMPAQMAWNPMAYYGGLSSTFDDAGGDVAPATMGAQAYYTQVWIPMLFLGVVLYLFEKRRLRLRASVSGGAG